MTSKIRGKIIEFFQNKNLIIDDSKIIVEKAKNFGDYSSNAALIFARKNKMEPLNLALQIKNQLLLENLNLEKIEIAPPGFLNFFVSKSEYEKIVKSIIEKGPNFGRNFLGKKINIEFVSANPTGFLHLGHLRSAIIGDILANILEFTGNFVFREYYINDFGTQINRLVLSVFSRYQQIFKDFPLPADAYFGDDVIWCAQKFFKIFNNKFENSNLDEPETYKIFREKSVQIFLNEIKADLKNLSIKFDKFSSETELFSSQKVKKNLENLSYVFQKDGATWLKTTKFGDQKDRVLVKNNGEFTYFSSDIAYHLEKINDKFQPDFLINIWGADHIGYIDRIKAGLKIAGHNQKLNILLYQLVKLVKNGEEFKMSKRKGQTFTIKDLLQVASVDAIRYFLSERSYNSVVEFDVELANRITERNPLFLIQYAHARGSKLLQNKTLINEENLIFNNERETILISKLKQFEEIIVKIAKNYKINLLNKYLLELANLFNSFYSNSKIIGNKNENSLLCLTQAVVIVLKTGLKLLGIKAKERI
ncbi:arginine--tRNA ligase [Mycoplasma flocculare]|uniref:arginine--tRNA ligase n=1 Tax=Mesomycoplasma flocculare TaxID=2128 RepID=UPI00136F76AE|nr:arginine--tRNA ligase [Mesomycoplasma flocculare]MXR12007.1 arginine--tRNA ligase [Mesomycoplasma flocculare]